MLVLNPTPTIQITAYYFYLLDQDKQGIWKGQKISHHMFYPLLAPFFQQHNDIKWVLLANIYIIITPTCLVFFHLLTFPIFYFLFIICKILQTIFLPFHTLCFRDRYYVVVSTGVLNLLILQMKKTSLLYELYISL